MRRGLRIALVWACLVSGPAVVFLPAQQGEQPDRETSAPSTGKQWKPEDVVFMEDASQFRVSPDGNWVVWVKGSADKEKDGRVSHLFLSSLAGKKEIQLTRGSDSDSNPRWSPDGERILFQSTRPSPSARPDLSKSQLWLMNAFGGEPWRLTEFERGVTAYQWLDNDTIVFSAEEDPSLYERETKRKKDATRVVEDAAHKPPVRLFHMSLKDKKVTRLTTNEDWIEHWAMSRDGKKAVTVHGRSLSYEWDQKTSPVTFLYDLQTGAGQELFAGQRIYPRLIRWARDNSGFYVAAPHSTHPVFLTASITLVYYYDVSTGTTSKVDLGWENGLGGDLEVTGDGFVALLSAGTRFKPARYTRDGSGWTRAWLEGGHTGNLVHLVLGEDGKTLVYSYSTASRAPQFYGAVLDGARIASAEQITNLNPQFRNKTIAKTEVIRWKGALDEEVEGVLYYPHNYAPGNRYPLVIAIHGGPTGVDMDAWSDRWGYPNNLFAQRGAFVLRPNYHGSGNYGLKWVESICCGKYYDLEVPDIEKGVDALIAKGLVDPERIGTMGWSNGSILSIALTVENPARYKAAAVGAGDVEWISDWANVDFGQAFDAYYFGKSPLEDPQLYIRKSPIFRMDRVRTPTLIFFGTEDRNVPTAQGWTHYRTLYHLGKVPVRFLLFPGETHGPRKLTHQLRKVTEEMKWFDQYLFRTETAANEALKNDSPLAAALKKKSAARSGTAFGVAYRPPATGRRPAAEVLIPEVVKRGEMEIGRFEVTRAQYSAFDHSSRFEPGTENFPANGVTLEDAKAYAAWLTKLTGQTYRVPNESEVSALYKNSSGENTLDYWAGYAANPEDAARLASSIKGLGASAPLLKEAGSFRPDGSEGEEALFDLGGNVTEWVIAVDGSGKTLGGSADRPAEPKAPQGNADLAYTGFRVVRGQPHVQPSAALINH